MTKAKANAKTLAPVVSIINMKGGVGKTTITAHLFREFYRVKLKNVLLIDIDPQFNLTQTLIKEDRYERLKSNGRTILSIMEPNEETSLYATHETIDKTPEPEEIHAELKYILSDDNESKIAKLHLIPGDFSLCKYSLISDKKILQKAKLRFEQFINNARTKYDLICIDCNPSSSFLTTCSLKASSHLLIPVRPDRYSMLGLRMLDKFVQDYDELVKKPKKVILLNGIPTKKYDPTVENELRSDPEYGPITMATSFNVTRLLEANPSYTGFATDKKVSHSKSLRLRMKQISTELAVALGMK